MNSYEVLVPAAPRSKHNTAVHTTMTQNLLFCSVRISVLYVAEGYRDRWANNSSRYFAVAFLRDTENKHNKHAGAGTKKKGHFDHCCYILLLRLPCLALLSLYSHPFHCSKNLGDVPPYHMYHLCACGFSAIIITTTCMVRDSRIRCMHAHARTRARDADPTVKIFSVPHTHKPAARKKHDTQQSQNARSTAVEVLLGSIPRVAREPLRLSG